MDYGYIITRAVRRINIFPRGKGTDSHWLFQIAYMHCCYDRVIQGAYDGDVTIIRIGDYVNKIA